MGIVIQNVLQVKEDKIITVRLDPIFIRIIEDLAEYWRIKKRKSKYISETIRMAILYAYMHSKYGITLGKDSKEKVVRKLLEIIDEYGI